MSVKYFRFDSALRDDKPDDQAEPTGRQTELGGALMNATEEAARDAGGASRVEMFILSDGKNNAGVNPLTAASKLKALQIPVNTVAFGSPDAGPDSRDIAVQDLVTAPTVFVKNQLEVRGTIRARGFAGQSLDVEMLVEGQTGPVAMKRVTVPENGEIVNISGLKYIPQQPGEKQITLRVQPKTGELGEANNAVSTFVKVLKGGLNALFVQGPHAPWEQKFLMRSIASSPDIQADLRVVRSPGQIDNELLTPARYDVYILSDLPAAYLTPAQHGLLARGRTGSGADHAGRPFELRARRLGEFGGRERVARHHVAATGKSSPREASSSSPTSRG